MNFVLSFIFILGYLGIIFESYIRINKAAVALLTAVILWMVYFLFEPSDSTLELMTNYISGLAQIIFFLLAAMAIVELIDAHGGFRLITDMIYSSSKRNLMWFLVIISFFMSAVLDNLTSMIVMISLIRKLIPHQKERWLMGSLIVIAVNAGGAWTPIGDVTTTLLWVHDKITTWTTIKTLFLPSVVNVVVATLCAMFLVKGENKHKVVIKHPMEHGAKRVLLVGSLALIMIPVWKALLGIPPFMGALLGLAILWAFTDYLHFSHGDKRAHLRLPHILSRIDVSSVLFFLGILLAVDALEESNILKNLAEWFESFLPNQNYMGVIIGLLSSVIDNIPIVAATIGMYDAAQFPTDSSLWLLIAYAAGTGGSILIIGSAAGVAFMGMEKVDFIWYLKYISLIALIGYAAGLATFFLLQ